MNEIHEFLKNHNIKSQEYQKCNSCVIINTKDGKFVLKEKTNDYEKNLRYLKARNFDSFPKSYYIGEKEKYEINEYIEDYEIPKYDRAEEIINLVSLLHNKTTTYEEISIDDYKVIYEDIDNKINSLITYFNELNDVIDDEIYMSPSNYLLVRNISKIYASLDYCRNELNEWYSIIKNNLKQRKVLIHNNLELDHLIKNERSYLISWNNSKKDIPIYDLYNFYKKNYKDLEFESLFELYQNRYPLHEEERKLFFILISIPKKLVFTDNEYNNCKEVSELLTYLIKTEKLISPYYAEEQTEE